MQGWRWKNRPHLGEWEDAVAAGRIPAIDVEALSPRQRAGELAMLMLRLSQGVQLSLFRSKTGQDPHALFGDTLSRLSRNGLLSVDADAIRIPESGLPLADAIAAEFLA
jgi:oxygen-independent coproporphyrinogen-3 oxidase